MTEENIKIKSQDDLEGVLKRCNSKTQKLIIFIQGSSNQQGERFFDSSASFFQEKGFDTFIFNIHQNEQSVEKFTDMSVLKNIVAFETVLDYFKDEYSSIRVVSYESGVQILTNSNCKNIRSCVLWQPIRELESSVLISEEAQLFTKPMCIIVLSLSDISIAEDLYNKHTNRPSQFSTIHCSSFNFNKEDSEKEKELLYITLAWFERY